MILYNKLFYDSNYSTMKKHKTSQKAKQTLERVPDTVQAIMLCA